MKRKIGYALAGIGLCWGMNAIALDASGKRYIDLMVNGGPTSIRTAAEDIYNTGTTDLEVLDVAAETLVQGYQKNVGSETQMDAMAWICRALGNSGNGRYKAVVEDAAKSGNRKLKKHCDRAADGLPAAQDSYQPGSVNLAKYKAGGSGAAAATAAPAKAAAPAAAHKASAAPVSFDDVKEGMSMEEVNALIGQPTATTSHMTGKAWAPFNFKGKDTVRLIALYKGVGRIIYSKESHYTSTFRVMEIVRDANESGYP